MTIRALAVPREHNTESRAAHLLDPERTWVSRTLENTRCSHVAVTGHVVWPCLKVWSFVQSIYCLHLKNSIWIISSEFIPKLLCVWQLVSKVSTSTSERHNLMTGKEMFWSNVSWTECPMNLFAKEHFHLQENLSLVFCLLRSTLINYSQVPINTSRLFVGGDSDGGRWVERERKRRRGTGLFWQKVAVCQWLWSKA